MVIRLNDSEMTKEWHVFYTTIDIFSETEIKLTNHLIRNMCYSKGKRQGQILFAHLQNKAAEFIESSIYKPNSSAAALTKENASLKKQVQQLKKKNLDVLHQIKSLGSKLEHVRKKQNNQISKVRANARRKKSFFCNLIKSYPNSLFLDNKKHYSSKAIVLTICLFQIGKMSFHDTIHYMRIFTEYLTNKSVSTIFSLNLVICWNKEILKLTITNEFMHCNNSEFYNLGILADKLTRDSTKVL
ncbi:hypothetical protein GLOIN_2v1765750 [Rhizophagus irregularis DAOM 181602=DAOM 197198]|nr:hypothetical protein GLOIN_2v1765750 [Rhizophagus irregularis DAOM 181602=DAOM 197198]CAG8736513.1 7390_t:CDS:1 [Rhizophagus irregularis]